MDEDILTNLELLVFSIVGYSGEAKSHAYRALTLSENGDFKGALEFIEKCDASLLKAHNFQTSMIQRESNGEKSVITMLYVHAQDHLMTAISERELIKKMITQNERLYKLEKALNL